MKTQRHVQCLIWICNMLCLTACGFHLRGITLLPAHFNQVMIINHHADPVLVMALQKQLHQHHIQVVNDVALAHYTIILEKDERTEQLTNVAASTAPRQYQFIYQVQFQCINHTGHLLIPSQTVTIQQEVVMNNNRILGSNFEARVIENDLKQHAATQILDRISITLPQ